MKRPQSARRRLLTPLVYLAAVLLLLEEWLWNGAQRAMARLACWPPLHRLERRVRMLGPRAALAALAVPAVLLFPVKLLALYAMTTGHAVGGICVIVLAKLVSAAATARLYALTLPALATIAWFARLLAWFFALRRRWVARLRASAAWRELARLLGGWGDWRREWRRRRLSRRAPAWNRWRPGRVLRRFAALWRLRRR